MKGNLQSLFAQVFLLMAVGYMHVMNPSTSIMPLEGLRRAVRLMCGIDRKGATLFVVRAAPLTDEGGVREPLTGTDGRLTACPRAMLDDPHFKFGREGSWDHPMSVARVLVRSGHRVQGRAE